jgi:hypothetical protein
MLHLFFKHQSGTNKSDLAVVMAGSVSPYGNHLNIGVTLDSTVDGFDCQALVEELTALTAVLAPEPLGADALESIDLELEAICEFIDYPESAITNYLGDGIGINRRGRRAIAF